MSNKDEKKSKRPTGVEVKNDPNSLAPQRRRVLLHCGESLTEQAHKADCDINQIVAKYSGNELRELVKQNPAFYADLSSAPDFLESMNIVITAQQQFDALPSAVRKEFDNDPAKFLAFAGDSRNNKRLIDMGLATLRPKVDPPASKGDIEALITAAHASPKGKSPKGQPTGGPQGSEDA